METLAKLFGGTAKVKIMRLFLFNPGHVFDAKTIVGRTKVKPGESRSELGQLERVGLIKKRVIISGLKKKKSDGWILNERFLYLKELQNLLINTILLKNEEIIRRLSRVGKIKLVIISGVFIQEFEDSRVDLLVVGDNIRKNALASVMATMESEIGKEIRYASFETPDFQYRLGIYDKLIRDILDYSHEKIIDRLQITK